MDKFASLENENIIILYYADCREVNLVVIYHSAIRWCANRFYSFGTIMIVWISCISRAYTYLSNLSIKKFNYSIKNCMLTRIQKIFICEKKKQKHLRTLLESLVCIFFYRNRLELTSGSEKKAYRTQKFFPNFAWCFFDDATTTWLVRTVQFPRQHVRAMAFLDGGKKRRRP